MLRLLAKRRPGAVTISVRFLILFGLVVVIAGYGVSGFFGTNLSALNSLYAAVESMTGGSGSLPAEVPEWLIGYSWAVRLSGWLLIPTIVAVLLEEAQEARVHSRELRLATDRYVAEAFPNAARSERAPLTDEIEGYVLRELEKQV